MTALELMHDLIRCGPQDLTVSLTYIANRLFEARLAHGQRVTDAIDAQNFLYECAAALENKNEVGVLK